MVEDNAHGLFARYRGKYTGTFGRLATQSFHETKNVTCGEGGALIVNDPALVERALIVREKGTNRSQFFRGQVDKYSWVDVGSSYLPSDLLAAFLFAPARGLAGNTGRSAGESGDGTTTVWRLGRLKTAYACRWCLLSVSKPITCSTWSCRRSSSATR